MPVCIIADDDQDVLRLLRGAFKLAGFEPYAAVLLKNVLTR